MKQKQEKNRKCKEKMSENQVGVNKELYIVKCQETKWKEEKMTDKKVTAQRWKRKKKYMDKKNKKQTKRKHQNGGRNINSVFFHSKLSGFELS